MYFEDIDIGSLHDQKVPYPFIEAVVLNDQGGISVEMRYCFYAPVNADGKDIFDSYKHLLSTNVILYTYDASQNIKTALTTTYSDKTISDEGPFIKMDAKGADWYFNPGEDSQHVSELEDFTQSVLYQYEGQKYRKFIYTVNFKNLKAMEFHPPTKLDPNPGDNTFIADDRIVDLMGFIQVSADLGAGSTPFAIKSPRIAYAFPFVIAKGGIVDFKYQVLQTDQSKMWAGPYSAETVEEIPKVASTSLDQQHTHEYTIDEFGNGISDLYFNLISTDPESGENIGTTHSHNINGYEIKPASMTGVASETHVHQLPQFGSEIITKIPADENNSNLTSVVVSDPIALSNFVGFSKADIFELGDNKKVVKNLQFASKLASTSFENYFDSRKLEAMTSPFSEIFFWDDTEPSVMNLAFMFDIGKFMQTAMDFNNGSNAYGLNIKSMSLLRKKVAKNIDEKFTKDFTEEIIWSSATTAQLKKILDGAVAFNTEELALRGYNCSTANSDKTIFVVKDKTVNKRYKYEYRVKVTYDSKFAGDMSSLLLPLIKSLDKFSGLENVIMLSKFYNSNFGRMTPKFVKEFGTTLDDLRQNFNKLFVVLVGFLGEDYYNNIEAFLSAQQVAYTVGKLLSFDENAGTTVLTPGTFFIIKDVIQQSINQAKTFAIIPNVNQKIKGASSKAPAISTKYYKLPSGPLSDGATNYSVGFEGPAHFFLDYFSKETPVKSTDGWAIQLDKGQLETLQKLEIAKYLGNANLYGEVKFQGITPLALTAGKASIKTLNDDNLFILDDSQLTDFVLSMQEGTPKSYEAPGNDTQINTRISPLLDSLLKDGVSVIDSTKEETFTSPTVFSKMSFVDFFGGAGNPFDPKNEAVEDVTGYQDLKKFTTIYNFIAQLGFKNYTTQIKQFLKPIDGADIKPENLPVPYFALAAEPNVDEASVPFRSLYLDLTLSGKLNDEKSMLAILLFTNVVEMWVYMPYADSNKGSSWRRYEDVKNNLTMPNVLARWQFVNIYDEYNTLSVSNLSLNQRIADQYFIFNTGNVSDKITFKIPNIIAPPKSKKKPAAPIEFAVSKNSMNVFSKAAEPATKNVVSVGLKQNLFDVPAKSSVSFAAGKMLAPGGTVQHAQAAATETEITVQSTMAADTTTYSEKATMGADTELCPCPTKPAMMTMSVSIGVLSNFFGNVASSKTTGKSSKSGKSIEGTVGKMEVKQPNAQPAEKKSTKTIKGKLALNIPMNFDAGKY